MRKIKSENPFNAIHVYNNKEEEYPITIARIGQWDEPHLIHFTIEEALEVAKLLMELSEKLKKLKCDD